MCLGLRVEAAPEGDVYECLWKLCQIHCASWAGDALVEHLLSAAAEVSKVAGCELYIINTSPTELESVWVTEVWRSQEEHDLSLTIEGVQVAIRQILPLLAGSPEKIDVLPVGGKGWILS